MKAFYETSEGKTEIARISTFGCMNTRDIARRLMATCDAFKSINFHDTIQTIRAYDAQGLIHRGEGYLVIYHNS